MAKPIILKESIVIIGSEMHSKNGANKLMFAAQAIRGMRVYLDKQSAVTVLMYRVGYEIWQMNAVKSAANGVRPDSKFVEIASDEELINYINTGSKDGKTNVRIIPNECNEVTKVFKIYSFSHGVTKFITYKLTNTELSTGNFDDEFGIEDVSKFKSESFTEDAIFYSNACRTGVGIQVLEDLSKSGVHPELSLGQIMADKMRIKVVAWGSRTDYSETWGTSQERNNYEHDWLYTDPPNAVEFNRWREKEINVGGVLWNPEGAFHRVKAGTTPLGAMYQQIMFIPQKIIIPTKTK